MTFLPFIPTPMNSLVNASNYTLRILLANVIVYLTRPDITEKEFEEAFEDRNLIMDLLAHRGAL